MSHPFARPTFRASFRPPVRTCVRPPDRPSVRTTVRPTVLPSVRPRTRMQPRRATPHTHTQTYQLYTSQSPLLRVSHLTKLGAEKLECRKPFPWPFGSEGCRDSKWEWSKPNALRTLGFGHRCASLAATRFGSKRARRCEGFGNDCHWIECSECV